jgi:hypothetical protein
MLRQSAVDIGAAEGLQSGLQIGSGRDIDPVDRESPAVVEIDRCRPFGPPCSVIRPLPFGAVNMRDHHRNCDERCGRHELGKASVQKRTTHRTACKCPSIGLKAHPNPTKEMSLVCEVKQPLPDQLERFCDQTARYARPRLEVVFSSAIHIALGPRGTVPSAASQTRAPCHLKKGTNGISRRGLDETVDHGPIDWCVHAPMFATARAAMRFAIKRERPWQEGSPPKLSARKRRRRI